MTKCKWQNTRENDKNTNGKIEKKRTKIQKKIQKKEEKEKTKNTKMHDMTKLKSNIIMPPQAAATTAPALSPVRLERRTAYKLRAESTEYACEIYNVRANLGSPPKARGGVI